MNDQLPKRESMSIEEAAVSNMWEIAAIVEVLEQEGLCTHTVRPLPASWTQALSSMIEVFQSPQFRRFDILRPVTINMMSE
jgi:hypothetical protein